MKKLPTKYSEEQVSKAKAMYLRYSPVTDIAKATGMTTSSINYYAKTQWLEERDERRYSLIAAFTDKKKLSLTEIVRDGVDALKIAVSNTLERADILSLDEQTKLLRIIEGIDKIARLDEGKATEITGNTDKARVVEVVNPFTSTSDDDEDEVEYKELE